MGSRSVQWIFVVLVVLDFCVGAICCGFQRLCLLPVERATLACANNLFVAVCFCCGHGLLAGT